MSNNKKSKSINKTFLSENHRNYYEFLKDTPEPAAVCSAVKRKMIKKWSKTIRSSRCKSSSNVSSDSSSQHSTVDTDASHIKYNSTSALSNPNFSVHVRNEIKNYKKQRSQTEVQPVIQSQTDDSAESVNTNKQNIILHFNIPKSSSAKKPFTNCLRQKSKSFESFFILPNSEKYNNSFEGYKKQDKKQIVGKNKTFSSFQTPNHCIQTSAQLSSIATNTSVLSDQETLKKLLLSPQRAATATKLSELKSARPIRSSKQSILNKQRNYQQSVSADGRVRSKSVPAEEVASLFRKKTSKLQPSSEPIVGSHQYQTHDSGVDRPLGRINLKSPTWAGATPSTPPPPPAPKDPSDEHIRHTFYIRDENNTELSSISGLRRVVLKSTITDAQISLDENSTINNNTYGYERLSRKTELAHNTVCFEPLVPQNPQLQSENSVLESNHHNNCEQHRKQQLHYNEKKNEQLLYTEHCRHLNENITSRPASRNITTPETENHEHICLRNHQNFQDDQVEIHTCEPRTTSNHICAHTCTHQTTQQKYHVCLSVEEPQPSTSRDFPRQYFEQPLDQKSDIEHYKILYVNLPPQECEQNISSHSEDVENEQAGYDQPQHSQIYREELKFSHKSKKTKRKYNRHHSSHTTKSSQQKQGEGSDSKVPSKQKQPLKRPAHISLTFPLRSDLSFWRRENFDQLPLDTPSRSVGDRTNIFIGEGSQIYEEYLECHSDEYSPEYYNKPILDSEYPESEDCLFCRHYMTMGSLEDHERKIIIEFCHLLEKSKQLFNGLRELPQYGHKQWHSYFGRTFDVYTKLWKFQQQHRGVLDIKYGLKRWQIGEIASKIGQLYYHFYLRTSETAYLNEAYSFYFAIRGRSYYTKASKEDKCELMVKKLRYYARFIVVCLLLKKLKLVRDLINELDRQIIDYGNTYDPDDQIEWTVVMDEVKSFVQAEPVVTVIHPDNYTIILSHRLNMQTTPSVERSALMTLTLHEVIIVGSSSYQVKFSELTMDMFRMLQTLEREPTVEIQQTYDDSPRHRYNITPSALNSKCYSLEAGAPHCDNPHKYLLFKPTPNQILVYLASSCDDLPPNGVLLVYISAEGQIATPSKHIEDGYDIGGLITTSKGDVHRDANKDVKGAQAKYRDVNSFHPGDLFPFTRRPLFVIIDSDNSYAFQNMPRHFGQPLVILMSPVELPPTFNTDRRHHGNLFTLFLHSPLTAFCYCCDIHTLSLIQWDKGQAFVDTFLAEASLIITRSKIDSQYLSFMGDDFLRLFILRFIFCEVVLRMHRAFRTRAQLARSAPPIPEDILEHPALMRIVMELAVHLQTRSYFQETSAPPNKE